MGDLQCAVLSTLETRNDAVLNISTSAQIAFVADKYTPNAGPPKQSPVEYTPYFNGKFLAVAASLNGGNSLALFVKLLQQWTLDLGFNVPQCKLKIVNNHPFLIVFLFFSAKIWEKIIALSSEESAVSDMQITPTFLGERHNPNTSASVSNIHVGNLQLGQVFRALCRGLVENLHGMMPRDLLIEAEINRIVGNGSGLSRNIVLQKEVHNFYQLPLVFTTGGDGAKGAALACSD